VFVPQDDLIEPVVRRKRARHLAIPQFLGTPAAASGTEVAWPLQMCSKEREVASPRVTARPS